MLLDSAYITVKSASEVGAVVRYLLEDPEDDRAFRIEVANSPLEESALTVLVVAHPPPEILTLANGQELARCWDKEGSRVDILFPQLEARYLPCYVFMEAGVPPAGPPRPVG